MQPFNDQKMETSKQTQIISIVIAIAFCIVAPTMGYIKIGLPPVIIVGGVSGDRFFILVSHLSQKSNRS